ncbi:carbohydrate sulfotransferase 11-like [Penaeus japonicus]|uniref:carbohydrate sulfotransferase 11-like n=1 Tax=Penaeus japonicus TaxID=27405 RepID=UPI001C70D950|nr:carbohydrate sulfotransferase 11-like [Penaeus japonicus]
MRFYTRRNIKGLLYLIAGLFTFKLVIERSDSDNQKRRASAREVFNEVQPDLLEQDQQLLLQAHNKGNADENKDIGENGGIRDLEEIVESYEYKEEEEEGGDGPVDFDIVQAPKEAGVQSPLDEKIQKDLDFFEEREKVYRERRERVQQVCTDLGGAGSYGSLNNCPLKRLRWLVSHKMLMCFNAKVGTSTWMQYLMEAGFPGVLKNSPHWHYTAERYLKPPQKRHSETSKDLMKTFGKVVIVRDPFARIVSAYIDKISTRSFAKLCRYIISKYRPNPPDNAAKQPSFEEFVRFLVDHTSSSDSVWKKLETRTDRHWFPFYANCFPCDLQYDVIATMDTIHEDTRYIMQKYKLGLSDSIWGNHRASTSSEDKALALFKTIPRNLTLALYQRNRIDFLMFGYSVEKYLTPSS